MALGSRELLFFGEPWGLSDGQRELGLDVLVSGVDAGEVARGVSVGGGAVFALSVFC